MCARDVLGQRGGNDVLAVRRRRGVLLWVGVHLGDAVSLHDVPVWFILCSRYRTSCFVCRGHIWQHAGSHGSGMLGFLHCALVLCGGVDDTDAVPRCIVPGRALLRRSTEPCRGTLPRRDIWRHDRAHHVRVLRAVHRGVLLSSWLHFGCGSAPWRRVSDWELLPLGLRGGPDSVSRGDGGHNIGALDELLLGALQLEHVLCERCHYRCRREQLSGRVVLCCVQRARRGAVRGGPLRCRCGSNYRDVLRAVRCRLLLQRRVDGRNAMDGKHLSRRIILLLRVPGCRGAVPAWFLRLCRWPHGPVLQRRVHSRVLLSKRRDVRKRPRCICVPDWFILLRVRAGCRSAMPRGRVWQRKWVDERRMLRAVSLRFFLCTRVNFSNAVYRCDVPRWRLLRIERASAAVPSGELWEPDGPHERGLLRTLRGGVLLRSGEHLGDAVRRVPRGILLPAHVAPCRDAVRSGDSESGIRADRCRVPCALQCGVLLSLGRVPCHDVHLHDRLFLPRVGLGTQRVSRGCLRRRSWTHDRSLLRILCERLLLPRRVHECARGTSWRRV